jgi:hypothetical protein
MSLIRSVRSLFSMKPPPTKYLRSSGAICYEVILLDEPDKFISTLVEGALYWSWTSWPKYEPLPPQPDRYRPLTENTQERLRSVVHEERGESYANSVALFGWNDRRAADARYDRHLQEIQSLAQGKPGPLEIAIIAPNDTFRSYVFTRDPMSALARQQFAAWSVDFDEYITRRYSALGTMTLERFLESESRVQESDA